MPFALVCSRLSAAVIGLLAVELKTTKSIYFMAVPSQPSDEPLMTEGKTDDFGADLIEEDDENVYDANPPAVANIPPKNKIAMTPLSESTITWEALEELLDVIRNLGPVSGRLRHTFNSNWDWAYNNFIIINISAINKNDFYTNVHISFAAT